MLLVLLALAYHKVLNVLCGVGQRAVLAGT